MANLIKQKEFLENKNKSFTVVTFDKYGTRVSTRCGLSFLKVTEEIINRQKQGYHCILFNDCDLPLLEVSFNESNYDKYKVI